MVNLTKEGIKLRHIRREPRRRLRVLIDCNGRFYFEFSGMRLRDNRGCCDKQDEFQKSFCVTHNERVKGPCLMSGVSDKARGPSKRDCREHLDPAALTLLSG